MEVERRQTGWNDWPSPYQVCLLTCLSSSSPLSLCQQARPQHSASMASYCSCSAPVVPSCLLSLYFHCPPPCHFRSTHCLLLWLLTCLWPQCLAVCFCEFTGFSYFHDSQCTVGDAVSLWFNRAIGLMIGRHHCDIASLRKIF